MDTPVRLFLLLTAFLIPGIAYATESNPVLIDFVMAHKPGNEDNVALIQAFADRVKNRTKGGVIISPETHAPQSGEEYDGSFESILSKVYTGEIAMSQISVKKFADISPVIDVLDMPMVSTATITPRACLTARSANICATACTTAPTARSAALPSRTVAASAISTQPVG